MKSIEILTNRLASLRDSYQHYTMVDKDKDKAFWIKNDIEEVEILLNELNRLNELTKECTFAEIEKMWENVGGTFEFTNSSVVKIHVFSITLTIDPIIKKYTITSQANNVVFTPEMHELIHKTLITFKIIGG